MIITSENLFLIVLGLVWIIGAVLQDLKRREVDNLWNFSLIGFALAYRISVSVFSGNYWFVLNGLIGLLIFLVLGNLFYYGRLFAGGDAKLLITLGAVLPLSYNWIVNFKIFGLFILLFLMGGAVYSLIWAIVLMLKNWKEFKKEFLKQTKNYKAIFFVGLIFAIVWLLLAFFVSDIKFALISLVVILFPFLFVFAKTIEESCLIKKTAPKDVTVGDWLYEDILVGRIKIKSNWEGVSKKELELIKKKCKGKILIKQGIPFTPGFLIGFIMLLWLGKFWL